MVIDELLTEITLLNRQNIKDFFWVVDETTKRVRPLNPQVEPRVPSKEQFFGENSAPKKKRRRR